MTHLSSLWPVISFTNVAFAYDGREVLKDVTFTIAQNSYVGIVGPNGGGKTTVLKLMVGILQPTAGEITIMGKPAEPSVIRSSVGYVPQRLSQREAAFPATVEEIVRSGRTAKLGLFRRYGKDDARAVEAAIDTAGIKDYRKARISDLSGGQSQKVYIARALAAEPEILLLDEPSTGVDLPSRDQFDAFLSHLHKDMSMTIVVVSHDIEALSKGVESMLCVNGTVLDHCDASCFADGDAFKKLYGDRAMSVAHHHHH